VTSADPAASRRDLVVPIFPLPDVTLFPHTVLPLHVFEARYRAMITDALARDRLLAVARLMPGYEEAYAGKPPVAPVAGAGEIVKWERLPGGRYNILVEGRWRVRIERELPTDTLYRLVQAVRLTEIPAGADAAPLLERVRTACRGLLEALDRPADLMDTLLARDQSPGAVADRAAAAFVPDPAIRQALLETVEVGPRLARLSEALETLLKDLQGGRGGA
jgi:Lon protease-like protein